MALTSNTSPRNAVLLQQIKQVCMTYVTQRYLWWGVAFVGLTTVPCMIISMGPQHGRRDGAPTMLFVIGMPMLAAVPFLVGLGKSQLAHARARLTPWYLPAHLIVLASILLGLVMFFPVLAALLAGFAPLGIVALAMAIGVAALWGTHLHRFAPLFVSMGVFYSLLTSWGLDWWIVKSTEHFAVHAAIVVLGTMLASAWLWRMSQLREEMDDYQNAYQMLFARRTSTEAIEQRRIVATQAQRSSLFRGIGDWWYNRIGGYYGGRMSGLVRLLKYGFQAAPIELQGLIFAAMMLCMELFFSRFSILPRNASGMGVGFFLVQFGIIMPGYMAGEMLAQRRSRTANEMLLPLSRRQLIDGLFAVSARNSVTLWLMMHFALGISLTMNDQPISPWMVSVFLLLSATTMLATLGISLRVSVWPSMAKRLMVIWPVWVIIMPVLTTWAPQREKIGEAPFIAAAAVFAAIGIWAIRSARRAWLNLEFV